jgi:hypothetical protein
MGRSSLECVLADLPRLSDLPIGWQQILGIRALVWQIRRRPRELQERVADGQLRLRNRAEEPHLAVLAPRWVGSDDLKDKL